MNEPKVTDEMYFRLIIEHRDLFRALGPYMRPGFWVKMGMKPFGAVGPMFSCEITHSRMFNKKITHFWAVEGKADTLEEAVAQAVESAKQQRS